MQGHYDPNWDVEEIQVYDWGNQSVPRPAGTARLVDRLSSSTYRTAPGAVPNYSHFGFSTCYDPPAPYYQQHQSSSVVPVQVQPYSSYNSGAEWNNYNYRDPRAFRPNFYPTQTQNEWDLYSSSFTNSNGVNAGFANLTQNAPTKLKHLSNKDDDFEWNLDDVEEIDYNKPQVQVQTTERALNLENEVVTSTTSIEEEVFTGSVVKTPAPAAPSLIVPLPPSLPVDDILSDLPKKYKTSPLKGLRKSRKRPRNELEQTTDLEDLLSKTKNRASARSYARPTRKVIKVSSNGAEPPELEPEASPNGNLHYLQPDTTTSSVNDCDGSLCSSVHESFCEDEDVTNVSNSEVLDRSREEMDDTENVEEAILKIRTDIFEEDEESETEVINMPSD